MSSPVIAPSPARAPLFLSSLRLPATLTSADQGWDGIALALTPVRVRDSVSVSPPDWHFLNIAPVSTDTLIKDFTFSCGDKKDTLKHIHGARIQTLLPIGVSGQFVWGTASGGPFTYTFTISGWFGLQRPPAVTRRKLSSN